MKTQEFFMIFMTDGFSKSESSLVELDLLASSHVPGYGPHLKKNNSI